MGMAKRRGRGEGSITQRHDHSSCPAPVDGARPPHRCQGRWVGMLNLGVIDGKRRRKVFYGDTRKEVVIKLQEAATQHKATPLVTNAPTVESWLRYWLDVICAERNLGHGQVGLKTNTMKSHKSKVERYLIPHLGAHRLDRLQPEHLRAMYAAMRRQGLSEATLRQTHMILRRALTVAQREGKVGRNVTQFIDAPSTEKKRRAPLSLSDARKVLRLAGWGIPRRDPLGLRWYVALYLGMRQAEALGLRWHDVNMDDGYLTIARTLVRKPGEGLVFDTPKSLASRRLVPLPTVVLSRFKVAWAEHVSSGGSAVDLVFSDHGRPIDHRADWQAWSDLLTAAGVPHVALHAARNTAASLLEAAGVNDRMVAEILGHSSVQITHNYQMADLERRREAMKALETYYGSDGTG